MEGWKEFKKSKLDYLKGHLEKGLVDKDIPPLLNAINSKDNFVTSSSCIGRISLLEIQESKKDASFYKKFHRTVAVDEIDDLLNKYNGKKKIWFRCEPFILHVFAVDLENAYNFFKLCRKIGVKKGGIYSLRVFPMVEVAGSYGFELPVHDTKPLIDKDYLNYIVREANKLLSKNYEQLHKLRKAFADNL